MIDIVSQLTLFQQVPKKLIPRFVAELDVVHAKGEELGKRYDQHRAHTAHKVCAHTFIVVLRRIA